MIFSRAANHIQKYWSQIFSIMLPSIQHPMQWCQAEFQAKPGLWRLTIPSGTIYIALIYIGRDWQEEDDQPNYSQDNKGKFRWRPPAERKYLQHVQCNSLFPISHLAVICCVTGIPSYYDMNLLRECLQTCLSKHTWMQLRHHRYALECLGARRDEGLAVKTNGEIPWAVHTVPE